MPKLQRPIPYLVAALLALAPLSAQAGVVGDTMDFLGLGPSLTPAANAPAHAGMIGGAMNFLGLSNSAPKPAAEAAPAEPVVLPQRIVAARPIFEARTAELAELDTPSLPGAAVAVAELPAPSVETPLHKLFCVEYARARSGLAIIGDAKFWWAKAKNLYARAARPVQEAVMVFSGSRRLKYGHVAVVTNIVSPREIRVDQANWENHGEIDHSTPVLDVSKNNDWSQVRVWDIRSRTFGAHVYAISGFIAKGLVQRADAE